MTSSATYPSPRGPAHALATLGGGRGARRAAAGRRGVPAVVLLAFLDGHDVVRHVPVAAGADAPADDDRRSGRFVVPSDLLDQANSPRVRLRAAAFPAA